MRYFIYHFAVSLHLKELYCLYKHLGQYEKQFCHCNCVYDHNTNSNSHKSTVFTPSEFRKGSMVFLTFLPKIASEKGQLMIPTTG